MFAFLFLSCKKDEKTFIHDGHYVGSIEFAEELGIPNLFGEFVCENGTIYCLSNDSMKFEPDFTSYPEPMPLRVVSNPTVGVVHLYGVFNMNVKKVDDTFYIACYHGDYPKTFLKSTQMGSIILKEK